MTEAELAVWREDGENEKVHFFDFQGPPRPDDFDWQMKQGAMIGFYGKDASQILRKKPAFFQPNFDENSRFDSFVFRVSRDTCFLCG